MVTNRKNGPTGGREKNTDLEAKMENGLKQPRGPPEKTNAGTILDYYKPKGGDSRPTQPHPSEGVKMEAVSETKNRGTHLILSPDSSPSCDVEGQIPETGPSRPLMAQTNTAHDLDH